MNPATEDADTVNRRQRQGRLKARLVDILDDEGDLAIIDLLNLALFLWAERYPANLSAKEAKIVSQNFEGATPSLIAERAMSADGMMVAMASFAQMAHVVIDYRPESAFKKFVDADMKLSAELEIFSRMLEAAFERATASGLSPYGVMCMMILFGTSLGSARGLQWPLVARPLLDALTKAMESATPRAHLSEKEAEERAISALMQQLHISRATAKRYVAEFKASGLA